MDENQINNRTLSRIMKGCQPDGAFGAATIIGETCLSSRETSREEGSSRRERGGSFPLLQRLHRAAGGDPASTTLWGPYEDYVGLPESFNLIDGGA
jgi:hypothetical protein